MLSVILMLGMVMSATVQAEEAKKDSKAIAKVRAELVKMIPDAGHVNKGHIMIGDLYDAEKQVNVGEQASNELMAQRINEVPSDKMIVFGPKKAKRYVTVFTDIDCGYCRKLHNEVAELNEAGIQVRYLAYPRAGLQSESYKKYVSVWCNADQQQAMTDAKSGKSVPDATCDNPIADSFKLGQTVGVRGTPTMILDDGTVMPFFVLRVR